MRTFFVIVILSAFVLNACNASKNIERMDYHFAVQFGSKCCGTPLNDFLKMFIQTYRTENKGSIWTDIAAGCGREGEYVILINIQNSDSIKRKQFYDQLASVVEMENTKNETLNTSSGEITLSKNPSKMDFVHCTLPIKTW